MLDDITQAALNEHAKDHQHFNKSLQYDAQNDKQTAFVDANGNKVVKNKRTLLVQQRGII